jgi:predicted LPLAT superfamily acyltransferase
MKPLLAPPRARHWADINEFSFVAGMRVLFWLGRALGRSPARLVLYPIVLWYMIAKAAARAASREYLLRVTQAAGTGARKPGGLLVLRHFASFAEDILDKMMLWSGWLPTDPIKYHNLELITAQLASKRGALVICCHLGNLELCRVLAKRMAGLKMTVLLHTKHAEKFNRLLARLNPASELDVMQVTELSPATAVCLAEKIARGEFVAIAGDRIPVSHHPRVAIASFLGASAPFPIGPYILANLFRCPVYLLFTLRAAGAAEIHFELFRDVVCLPRKDRERALAELAADYARRLEVFCRRAPLQWYNFYDFWQLPAMEGRDGPR